MSPPRSSAALHIPLNTLALRRGGLIKAVMQRANTLAADHDVVIEVLAHQGWLAADVAEMVSGRYLDPRVHVRSILRTLDPSAPAGTEADAFTGCVHHGDPAGPPRRPLDDPRSGVLADPHPAMAELVRAGQRHETTLPDEQTQRPRYVEVRTSAGQKVRRTELGVDGRPVRVVEYAGGKPVVHRWIGCDGSCFLAIWPRPGERDWGVSFTALDGVTALANPAALYRLAFEMALRREVDPVLFSEFRDKLPNLPGAGFDPVARSVRHPTLRRVAVIHSNHALVGERELPMRSSPNFTALLRDLDGWDAAVTATEQQRADIGAQYGAIERLRAVAHVAPAPGAPEDAVAVDPDRYVVVSRIHSKKRVDEALQAFRLILDENPAAHLDVYGFGYGDELERHIKDNLVPALGLTDSVHFRGFVDDPARIYDGACASLVTSASEGFGMVILESLANAVPVVAYDFRYGAHDAIRHEVDGFVVPWGDRAALARHALQLARDPALRATMGQAGREGVARFSAQRYRADWNAVVSGLAVRVDPGAAPDASVRHGRLRLRFPGVPDGTVLLRPRVDGLDLEAPIEGGSANVELPEAVAGDILDVFVRRHGTETRVKADDGGHSDDPTWRVYRTVHGNLSVRKARPEPQPAAGTAAPAAEAPPVQRRPARWTRRLRAPRAGGTGRG